ncbi:cytochrome oxidase subunit III [Candidatus Acetothermia bacterium]|jgi:cytochrome c oxidase subunit 3|nr:cytochrome oxidase subunit III [Candidatus Acetothermia bacterium]MCI2432525.1 cytochrome oxidase subunit III [Candidatus Acetothermia bacterium]MCI2436580.1 cytochrome oxidase subunit III [Candidatus Acetothermia bacterium]
MSAQTFTEANGSHPELPATKLALWLFLAVATMLFAMLLSAYLVRLGFSEEHALPKPNLLWFNTLLLVFSSLALERASRGTARRAPALWLVGGALAVLFLIGQLFAWSELAQAGYFLATNPASSFFYLLTALHGMHLLGGLVAWTRTASCVIQEGRGESRGEAVRFAPASSTRVKLELCAFYWHFLLAVWVVILILVWMTT